MEGVVREGVTGEREAFGSSRMLASQNVVYRIIDICVFSSAQVFIGT